MESVVALFVVGPTAHSIVRSIAERAAESMVDSIVVPIVGSRVQSTVGPRAGVSRGFNVVEATAGFIVICSAKSTPGSMSGS
eukprot:11223730-Lingulodinium_polyedra.AAC.1